MRNGASEATKCETCNEPAPDPRDACPESRRACGHHCNHALCGSGCDWCGVDPYGEQQDYEAFREIVAQPVPAEVALEVANGRAGRG